jgi:menaquinone-dependent protoporphyrinogen oxidase
MNPRVLVAYATRCGSTLEVAQALAQDLRGRGYVADLRAAEKVSGLSGYEAVVLGSAVPEAVEFVRRRQEELKRLPTAFFTVHGQNLGADEVSRKNRLAYIDSVRAMVRPGVEAFFAGKLDSSRLSFGARMLCKLMKATNQDLRDWGAIHAWAQGVFQSGVKS